MATNYKNFGLAALSGLLTALAYPSFGLGFLIWLALIPILLAISRTPASQASRFYHLKLGFIAGLVFFALVFQWFWALYPLDVLGFENKFAGGFVILIVYMISVAAMASFWGIWAAAVSSLGRTFWGLAPAGLFVLLEYLRAWGFGILWLGSGTLAGPHWTMGNPAYALASGKTLSWLAGFVGVYGLLFIAVSINCLIAGFITKKKNKILVPAAVILIIVFLPLRWSETGGQLINFTIIQTDQPTKIDYSPAERLAFFKSQLELLNRTAKEYPETQLIVFPETSNFFKDLALFLSTQQVQSYFSNLFNSSRLIISGSRISGENEEALSRVFFLDSKKDIIGFYDKELLVPFGEFLPYPLEFIARLAAPQTADQLKTLRGFSVGKNQTVDFRFQDQFSAAPAICSELLSPALIRNRAEQSGVIAAMASTGIFHGSNQVIKELLAVARMRAAENQKPLLLAANQGLSYAIDANGSTTKIAPNKGSLILTGQVITNQKRSWYNRLGDWPILLVSVLGLLGIKKSIKNVA